jgi:hypothetical protein
MELTHEHLALHALVSWGVDPESAFVAIEEGRLIPEHFHDHELRLVVEIVVGMVTAGEVPAPEAVVAALVAQGIDHAHAVDLVTQPGAFEATGCRLDGLAHWLTEVKRDHMRRLLVAAGFSLETRGGIERAREKLLEVVAA